MENHLLVLLVSIFFIIFLATLSGGFLSKKEGLANASSSGEAGLASGYADEIKAKTVELQDVLLVSKYRKEYESTLIQLDDYIGMLMIKQSLNLKLDGGKELMVGLDALNTLKTAKDNLNITMEHLDKQ